MASNVEYIEKRNTHINDRLSSPAEEIRLYYHAHLRDLPLKTLAPRLLDPGSDLQGSVTRCLFTSSHLAHIGFHECRACAGPILKAPTLQLARQMGADLQLAVHPLLLRCRAKHNIRCSPDKASWCLPLELWNLIALEAEGSGFGRSQ